MSILINGRFNQELATLYQKKNGKIDKTFYLCLFTSRQFSRCVALQLSKVFYYKQPMGSLTRKKEGHIENCFIQIKCGTLSQNISTLAFKNNPNAATRTQIMKD